MRCEEQKVGRGSGDLRRGRDGGAVAGGGSGLGVGDDGADVTVNRFSDGSVSVVTMEEPGAPSAISGCSRSGTSYSNCKVDFWYGLVSMSFRADYNLAPGNNRITNQWAASWNIGGACSTNKNYFDRPNARTARLEVQAQVCGVPYSSTFFLELTVGGNSASYHYG